jgi:hypothetical protein
MRAIAEFVQRDIRYVGIELGIGGFQPHSAADVFAHRYGDCKDKATLMSSMLKGVGVDSYYVIINTRRGAVTPDMPAHVSGFNHAVLAIKLPEGLNDPSLVAVMQDAKLGRIFRSHRRVHSVWDVARTVAGELRVAGNARGRRAYGITAAAGFHYGDPANGKTDSVA